MPAVSTALCRSLLLLGLLLPCAPAAAADCISLVPSAGGQAFWTQVQQGASAAAEELGVRLYFRGPMRDADEQVQLRIIDKLLTHGCRALIVAPSGPQVAARVAALKAAGVATFYLDRDLGGEAAIAAITTDNYRAGLEAGRQMARLLGGQGRVALLRLSAQVQSTSERERGFLEGASAGGLRVAMDRYLPSGDLLTARLARELRELDGVFTPSESTTQELLGALRRARTAGKLVHIGFDSNPLLVEALQAGELNGLMLQQPREMGYRSVQQAYRHLQGAAPPERRTKLAAIYVDAGNLDEPRIRLMLAQP
ncbi:MAG: substrate-binding domain-containing protein [Pseudomonas sp.]